MFEELHFDELQYRVPIVHKTLYLIFTEGYKASWGKSIVRETLCEEALLMNKMLSDSPIGNKESAALHALMLFNTARFKAWFSDSGELLDLEDQDRSLWDKDLILLACQFLKKCRAETDMSSYHYEACIAYLHSIAKDFVSTDWNSTSKLYYQLLKISANPYIELNYAIALYYSWQKQQALEILKELQQKPFLSRYYLLNATLGKLNLLERKKNRARKFFIKTLQQTNFQAEKNYIRKLLLKIDQ